MRTDAAREAIRAAVARLQSNPDFRRAYADLHETCASVVDARTDLATLLGQRLALAEVGKNPVEAAMARTLAFLPPDLPSISCSPPPTTPKTELIVSGLQRLLPEGLAGAEVLDLRAGGGDLMAALRPHAKAVYGLEPRLDAYYRTAARLGGDPGLAFANPLALPPQAPTPGFEFLFDENAERVRRVREAHVAAIVGDLRGGGKMDAFVRWAVDRLGPARRGVIAFVADEDLVDDPALASLRAELEQAFAQIYHVAGVTFLVRGKGPLRLFFADEPAPRFEETAWRELHPRRDHVWRTEILRPEWMGFMPLAGDRAMFYGAHDGMKGTVAAPGDRKARTVLKRPFALEKRRPERGVTWPEGPFLVVGREPFAVLVSNAPPDRRCLGEVSAFSAREVASGALARFRVRYGPNVTPRDLFDYAVALLHHPAYQERYAEDLRRGFSRVPLLEGLDALAAEEDAPGVGPGTAYGMGWTPRDQFEPGTIPDYDDPFASPYARADVEPGFLLFTGLGTTLARLQTQTEDLVPYPLVPIGETTSVERLRLSRDRTQVALGGGFRLEGIPPEASAYRLGAKSALEWFLAGSTETDAELIVRRMGQIVAASLEANRLSAILGRLDLSFPL